MKIRLSIALLLIFTTAAVLTGCSKTSKAADAGFAREVIDALYSGSLASINDRLGAQMQQPHVGQIISTAAPMLRQQFGAVKDLTLKSNEPSPDGAGMTQQIWTVSAEKMTFEMKMVLDKDRKLEGVWAQPATP